MHIYISKYTVLFGLVLLVLGVAIGYFGRPIIDPQREAALNTITEPTPSPTSIAQADLNLGDEGEGNDAVDLQEPPAQPVLPTSVPAPTEAASQTQELMNYVIQQTRHFRGDPNASITMIEFSDFL